MLAATFIATLFVPVFFDLLSRHHARRQDKLWQGETPQRDEKPRPGEESP